MNFHRINRRLFSPGVAPLCAFVLLGQLPVTSPAQVSVSPGSFNTNRACHIDLPTALRLANAQNLDIQIARERLKEAKASHESAVELFFPWISPGAVYRRHENRIQDVVGNIIDADKQSYTVRGALTAQLDLGDAVYKSLAAKQLVNAADHALESQRRDSTLAAAQGYYDLAKTKAIMDVVKEALSISRDYQNQLHDAVGAGLAFKGDELRVQTQTERYQLALRQALEQQRVAAARLAQILHLDSSVELVPQDTDLVPLTLVETNAPLDSLVQQALRSRPELRQSQALVTAAHEAKNGAVYGPLIPSLGAQAFGGGLGGGRNGNTGNFGESEDYFIGLSWRIGPGGLFDTGRIHASEARLEATRLSRAKVQDEITRQVVESHARAQSLLDQIATTKQNLATASETLRLTRERKQFGVGAVLEDIQAQQELTRARSDYLNAVAEVNKAQFALKTAIGGLLASGQSEDNLRKSLITLGSTRP
jgi:outer membrane protein TolC